MLAYRFQPEVMLDAIREHRPTFTVGAITAFTALLNTPGLRAGRLLLHAVAVFRRRTHLADCRRGRPRHDRCCAAQHLRADRDHVADPCRSRWCGYAGRPHIPEHCLSAFLYPTPWSASKTRAVRSCPIGEIGELVVRGPQGDAARLAETDKPRGECVGHSRRVVPHRRRRFHGRSRLVLRRRPVRRT